MAANNSPFGTPTEHFGMHTDLYSLQRRVLEHSHMKKTAPKGKWLGKKA